MNKFKIIAFACYVYLFSAQLQADITISTLYGSAKITEPVLCELLESQAMQRLKNINQYGVMRFIDTRKNFTRYQHSLGVLYLMRTYGANIEEQIIGLLHDVSHTIFSHTADYLFGSVLSKYSYQDDILEWFAQQTDIQDILKKYNYTDVCSLEKRETCLMLKTNLPDLCADRLEYNLHGGYIEDWLTQGDIAFILNNLIYYEQKWIFTNTKAARLYADVSVRLSTDIWCSAWNGFIFSETAHLFKKALDLQIITSEQFHFSTDKQVWDSLVINQHDEIQKTLQRIKQYDQSFILGTAQDHDYFVQGKFRGVDPLVLSQGSIVRLSQCDPTFKTYFNQAKASVQSGWYIKYCD